MYVYNWKPLIRYPSLNFLSCFYHPSFSTKDKAPCCALLHCGVYWSLWGHDADKALHMMSSTEQVFATSRLEQQKIYNTANQEVNHFTELVTES